MYLDLSLLRRAEYLGLFRGRFRIRRWAYILFFTGLFLMMWGVVAFGRALDWIFCPGFRRQKVRGPMFIIAPPRSGTTLTQKLMSLDEQRFAYSKMYQTILPSVCWQWIVQGLARLDEICGGPLAKLIGWAERKWFGGWDKLHKMRLNEPEEDDGFFVYTFVTEAIYLLFPYIEELWEAGFADMLPAKRRRRVMRYYRSCLQRQLYANGRDKTILSKATQFCGSIQSLLEEFPDARFITIVRHPYEAVASHVSVFYPVWRMHSPEIDRKSAVSAAYAKLAVEWYRHLHTTLGKLDPAQYYCIDYRDLVRDPQGTIRDVYEHFGFAMSEELAAKLAAAAQKGRRFKSEHVYTLEEFGLSRQWIQNELGPVLDVYGLEW